MRVKELIKLLKKQNQEAVVVLSSDSEGNSYSELSAYGVHLWDEEENEIVDEDDVDKDHGLQDAVVFWP